jgi:hypothetical protein
MITVLAAGVPWIRARCQMEMVDISCIRLIDFLQTGELVQNTYVDVTVMTRLWTQGGKSILLALGMKDESWKVYMIDNKRLLPWDVGDDLPSAVAIALRLSNILINKNPLEALCRAPGLGHRSQSRG